MKKITVLKKTFGRINIITDSISRHIGHVDVEYSAAAQHGYVEFYSDEIQIVGKIEHGGNQHGCIVEFDGNRFFATGNLLRIESILSNMFEDQEQMVYNIEIIEYYSKHRTKNIPKALNDVPLCDFYEITPEQRIFPVIINFKSTVKPLFDCAFEGCCLTTDVDTRSTWLYTFVGDMHSIAVAIAKLGIAELREYTLAEI